MSNHVRGSQYLNPGYYRITRFRIFIFLLFYCLQYDNFNQLKAVYGNVSIVNDQKVVFNIKGNEFRLVVSINFVMKACYTIWFGTHKEYDKVDTATVAYDTNINNFRKK